MVAGTTVSPGGRLRGGSSAPDNSLIGLMRDPCIVFLHLPKTGGWTLRATLRYKYPSRTHHLYNTPQPQEAIRKLAPTELRDARVVTGHVPYGIHRHIPQQCEYITLLREPVARVVSMYHYIRTHPKHGFFHRDELARSGIGLEQFIRTATDPGLDNLQTRMISGRKAGEVLARASNGRTWVAPKLDQEDLEAAKRNLERFLVVGLTERFDESFILIRRALGWRLPMYETHNVAKGPRPEPPPAAAIELIRERNQLDLELYDHARDLFSAAVERQGGSFRREVAAFTALNLIPNRIAPRIPTSLRRPLRSMLPR